MTPARKAAINLALLAAGITPVLLGVSRKSKEEAASLLARGQALADLRTADSLAFRLRAHVTVWDRGRGLEGEYSVVWEAPGRWREETNLPGYNDLVVADQGKAWRRRNVDYTPEIVSRLRSALLFDTRLLLRPREKVTRVAERVIDGRPAECVHVRSYRITEVRCFDPSSGTEVREEHAGLVLQFAEFRPLGNKLFPTAIRAFNKKGEPSVEIRVEELVPEPNPNSSLFVAPSGAQDWSPCRIPVPPRPLNTPPLPPQLASVFARGKSGRILFDILVGADGKIQNVTVVSSQMPELERAVLENVKRWQFSPGLCNDKPVPVETYFQFGFERH